LGFPYPGVFSTPRDITAEPFQLFEDDVDRKYKTGSLRIHPALIPTRRDALASALLEGKGDIAARSNGMVNRRGRAGPVLAKRYTAGRSQDVLVRALSS
jgi:hypothetical protein